MRKSGIQTVHSDSDADLLIAQTTVNRALINTTYVIAEDTDILVLLLHHIRINTVGLFLKSDEGNSRCPLWDISYIHSQLGVELCKYLPFLYALGVSDITSQLFGIGKGAVIKKKDRLMKYGEVFASKDIYHSTIKEAGEKDLVCLYGGESKELNEMRKRKFGERVVKSIKSVEVQSLPPTSDSAKYHSYRVYYQTYVWMGN